LFLYPGVKWPERGIDHPSSLCVQVKESVELYLLSVTYGMLQSVLYFALNIKVQFYVWLSPFTRYAVLLAQNGLLTSLPVAIASYHNCTDKPVTCHVTVQRYCQYNMLVTSVFKVLLGDLKKWH
jgi:hypothetical protein